MELLIFMAGIALLTLLGMYMAWPSDNDIPPGEHHEPCTKSVRRTGKA